MQKANRILQAIRKLGEKRSPLTKVYRCLFSEDLFLTAYAKIYRNQGAMTPGTEDDTVDDMSLKRIQNIIEALRKERFRFKPSRRIQIPKKSGGTRPLSIPNFTDKLVQEVLRMILEAYYEPRFRKSSHGFRPNRGCHTALAQLKETFVGTTWFIEGDIRGCFDNIDHDILLNILSRDIQDGRLVNLIRMSLKAGVAEEWKYNPSYSGTPQGGVLSPLLANIYLNELDCYIEDTLIPSTARGKKKKDNLRYAGLGYQILQARKRGDTVLATTLETQRRTIPSQDTHDPNYRRLTYIRYADDFILGFTGPKSEAEALKTNIGEFLREKLHLEMSSTKTLITHARTEHARFLNYAVSIYQVDDKLTRNRTNSKIIRRSINGRVRLGIPHGLVDEKCRRYQQHGKSVSEPTMTHFSDVHIIATYQQRFRGIAEYYKYAVDRCHLNKLKGVMQSALVKTLAQKYRIHVSQVYREYRDTREVNGVEYKILKVEVSTGKHTRLIYWGAVPLTTVKPGTETIEDNQYREQWTTVRSDLLTRLQANTCELCGSHDRIRVHHIRKLKDLKTKWAGRKQKPKWIWLMIAMQRKTLIVCHKCHADIHAGRPTPNSRE